MSNETIVDVLYHCETTLVEMLNRLKLETVRPALNLRLSSQSAPPTRPAAALDARPALLLESAFAAGPQRTATHAPCCLRQAKYGKGFAKEQSTVVGSTAGGFDETQLQETRPFNRRINLPDSEDMGASYDDDGGQDDFMAGADEEMSREARKAEVCLAFATGTAAQSPYAYHTAFPTMDLRVLHCIHPRRACRLWRWSAATTAR